MDYKSKITERGLKSKWIAAKIGISETLFSYYITGVRSMPEHVQRKLKEILA